MTTQQTPIAVLGAGSWGTAIATLLANNSNPTTLWSYDEKQIKAMQATRKNDAYLPGRHLPSSLKLTADLKEALAQVADVFIVVPSFAFRSVCSKIKAISNRPLRIAWGTKGLDPDTNELLYEVVADEMGIETPMAVLSGPSFAKEVFDNLPAAVSLAGNNDEFLQSLITRLHADKFRVYKNNDFIGVQFCGAIKNVLAIAIGIADGLALGANTRAALITRGLAEMSRLLVAVNGQAKTLMSLAGVGDLVLTCTDNQSRNRRFGLFLGKGMPIKAAEEKVGQVVEGLHNTKQIYDLSQKYQLDMPITTQVHHILYRGYSPEDVLQELLERAPKEE